MGGGSAAAGVSATGPREFAPRVSPPPVDVQDPAHRAYIKKRFIRLWRYLQDRYHHKKRGGYPDKLRDAYFEQGEVRADLHHIGWGMPARAHGHIHRCGLR